jgi:hypothetical protein
MTTTAAAAAEPAPPELTGAPAEAPPRAPPAATSEAPAGPHRAPPPAPGRFDLLEALVRDPDAFLRAAGREDGVALVRTLVAAVGAGAGVFGAVVGAFRGGAQVAYCAAKVPLALLGTLVVCTPAFVSVARATGTRLGARDVIALTLGACARFSVVLACLAPVVWLLEDWCDYHRMVLLAFAACAVAGLAAGALLFRGLLGRPGAVRVAGAAFVAVFGLVGAQTSWLLRPYVVRPQTRQTPLVRHLEGDLPDAIWTTLRSSFGVYDAGPAADGAPGAVEGGARARPRRPAEAE